MVTSTYNTTFTVQDKCMDDKMQVDLHYLVWNHFRINFLA